MTATTLNADIAGFADRVNNLLNEKDAISNDVREVYDEAKEQGINTKALRKVIAKRRAKTPDPAVVAAMEAYEHALDEAALMVSKGASLRQAEAATGFSKSAIQRRQVSHRNENAASGTPHDPTAGEITETAAGDRLGEELKPGATDSSLSSLENAAPQACVDGTSALTPAESVVPRCSAPQAEGVASAPVKPVPDEGVGGWQPSDSGAVGAKPRVASDEMTGEGCGTEAGFEPAEPLRTLPAPGALNLSATPSPQPDSHSTGDDGLELPRRLDRRVRA